MSRTITDEMFEKYIKPALSAEKEKLLAQIEAIDKELEDAPPQPATDLVPKEKVKIVQEQASSDRWTMQQASQLLVVNYDTLRLRVRKGKVPHTRLADRAVIFSSEQIEDIEEKIKAGNLRRGKKNKPRDGEVSKAYIAARLGRSENSIHSYVGKVFYPVRPEDRSFLTFDKATVDKVCDVVLREYGGKLNKYLEDITRQRTIKQLELWETTT
jgi:hypothetical protein